LFFFKWKEGEKICLEKEKKHQSKLSKINLAAKSHHVEKLTLLAIILKSNLVIHIALRSITWSKKGRR
jgi:hypothetical protein